MPFTRAYYKYLLHWHQAEYHGQLEDLEESRRSGSDVEAFQTSGEVAATSSKLADKASADLLVSIPSGDHLFFEDLNTFKPVNTLDVLAKSKSKNKKEVKKKELILDGAASEREESSIQMKNVEAKLPESVQNYLSEIDEQYFGTISNSNVSPAEGL